MNPEFCLKLLTFYNYCQLWSYVIDVMVII